MGGACTVSLCSGAVVPRTYQQAKQHDEQGGRARHGSMQPVDDAGF